VAHSLSAKKRIRQNVKRRMRNRAARSAVRTQIKQFNELVKAGTNAEEIEKTFRQTQKKIDELVAQGRMHKNTASRRKSQLARQFNAVSAKV